MTCAIGNKNNCYYSIFVLKVLTNILKQEQETKCLNNRKEKRRLPYDLHGKPKHIIWNTIKTKAIP